jgi:hypothetical protein
MLRLLLSLPSFFTDYRIIPELARCALTAGLATVSVLSCISVGFAIRCWLASRGPAFSPWSRAQ